MSALRSSPAAVEPVAPGAVPSRILHVDCDAFFCQCAYLTWPERLRGVDLLLVGGHPQRRGVVASCSYAARKQGVHSAMPMVTALRICPDATAAPVPWATVKRKSREVFGVLRRFAERLERVSVDEGYLLLPPSAEPLVEVARRIQHTVLEETAISVSIGGASRRFVAKIATGHGKPAGVFVVPPGEEYDFIGARTLRDIPGIGPAFLRELERRGVSSIASARKVDLHTLTFWLGPSRARFLYDRVRAIDPSPIGDGSDPRKSVSSETTFERDLWDHGALEDALRELVADVGRTIRKLRLRARTISVKVRGSDFEDRQKNRTLPQAVETDGVIYAVARELLREVRAVRSGPVRLLGVSLGKLEGPGSVEQLTFPEIIPPLETDEERRLARQEGR